MGKRMAEYGLEEEVAEKLDAAGYRLVKARGERAKLIRAVDGGWRAVYGPAVAKMFGMSEDDLYWLTTGFGAVVRAGRLDRPVRISEAVRMRGERS